MNNFEKVLEQSGKLLRKRLAAYFADNRQADRLTFKDLFRHSAKHGLIDIDVAERWLGYRDSRNRPENDVNEEALAEAAMKIMPTFIADSHALADMIDAARMTEEIHLRPHHRKALEALLLEHLPGVAVWAYGSRVDGRSHECSDLDLVLRGPDLTEIPIGMLGDFEQAVRESNIPILVEARDWARLPERFHLEIERNYVPLINAGDDTLEG